MADFARTPTLRALETVFLDRDGVLNEKMPEGEYVRSWEDFHLLPGVPMAIRRLNQAGLRAIVVSNQRGISLGLYTASDVQAIHSSFQELLRAQGAHVDGIYFCPHDKQQCNCRKPMTGLFDQAVADAPEIAAETSAIIGDSFSDIAFGQRLGMLTVFIDGPPHSQPPNAEAARHMASLHFHSLAEAVESLLGQFPPAEQH